MQPGSMRRTVAKKFDSAILRLMPPYTLYGVYSRTVARHALMHHECRVCTAGSFGTVTELNLPQQFHNVST